MRNIRRLVLNTPRETKKVLYKKNSDLESIMPGYPGNPFVNGRFLNEEKKPFISFLKVIKWMLTPNPQKKEKKKDTFRLNVIKNSSFFSEKKDMIVWLGHASFFIRIDGAAFLIDPVLRKPPFIKRYSPPPCGPSDVKNIDYLLISHTHRDHLDEYSIKKSNLKGTTALAPLGMGKLLESWNSSLTTQEAGWYQKFNTKPRHPSVYLLPAQHWSQRVINDTNTILWGSYLIEGKSKKIFFTGDTSFSSHFRKTGELLGPIDICLLPIGAYKPQSIMKPNHITPEEAVQAFHDLRGQSLFPMHYGTFDLSDEPPGEPVEKIKVMQARGEINADTVFLNPGEKHYL